jgi:hypothetical protein
VPLTATDKRGSSYLMNKPNLDIASEMINKVSPATLSAETYLNLSIEVEK